MHAIDIDLPKLHGKALQNQHWITEGMPKKAEPWLLGGPGSVSKDRANHHALKEVLHKAISHKPWRWPKHPVFFLADPHADSEAFIASLVASGGVSKIGKKDHQIKLTKQGRKGVFIIGGDCLDKGPSNLQLLRSVRNLMDIGAKVKLLAGNHDMRLLMGLRAFTMDRDPTTEHLFVRMGPKVVPLLKEVYELYLKDKDVLKGIPSLKDCRRKLFPSHNWFKAFPKEAEWLMPQQSIDRELNRMRKKIDVFEAACNEAGLSLRHVYATALKCCDLFLDPNGEFGWFFNEMQLTYKAGSFLFIHAGLDDRIINVIEEEGVGHLNKMFRKQIKHHLFEFYFGPLANTMRTKYRDVDMPLTTHGVNLAYDNGIHAIVHGHRNRTTGQRIMLRQGMIHIESDITLDRNSRIKEGLTGVGMGVTIINPNGQVIGISNDYPYAKVFQPETF
ncbi:MAG: metallophosphoesterase [Pseudomonadales bacterium]|nr:metallophosphoesterase [Pseudomonadales bacterium]